MKIVIASRKGGVGKTSVTSGLASFFASQGKRVLAIDLDPQSNLAFMLGGDPTINSVIDLLDGTSVIPQVIDENIHVFSGGPDLARQDLARLDPEDLSDVIASLKYDVVLFDCPPGSEHLERLGMVAADIALVVTNAHPIAIVGAQRVLDELERRFKKGRKGPKNWAIITNMIDTRRNLDKHIDELLSDDLDIPKFKIKQDSKIALATASGELLFEVAPNSPSALSITKVGEWCYGI